MPNANITSSADSTLINVVTHGDSHSPALILGNSLGTDLSMWVPQVEVLAERFMVICFDMRGHGKSAVPATPFGIDAHGRDVLDIADHFDIETFSYCGLSMGGMTGLWLAANAPFRLDSVIAANCAAFAGGPEMWRQRAAAVRENGVKAVAEATIERWFTDDFRMANPVLVDQFRKMMLATPREGYAMCCEAIGKFDLRPDLGKIAVPVLMIGGEHDQGPPPAFIEGTAAAIPNAKTVILPTAHISNHEAAAQFTSAVLEWIG
jgi:3-oxoadipate enol-lactonase